MSQLYWLASFPKSGSTWFRMLVANLGRDTPIDINDLPRRAGMASARGMFENVTLLSSGLLTHEECDRLRPMVHAAIAEKPPEPEDPEEADSRIGNVRFFKTHDAWTTLDDGTPLLGGAKGAAGAILIVRDPRDVVGSLANHNNQSIDETIAFMSRRDAALCGARDRQLPQFRQKLLDWSGFNASWLGQRDLPLHVIRYDELQRDTAGALARALSFAGVSITPAEAARAASFAGFDALRAQEIEHGFCEAPPGVKGSFFRRGVSGGWRDELTEAQRRAIEQAHGEMMARLSYPLAAEMTA